MGPSRNAVLSEATGVLGPKGEDEDEDWIEATALRSHGAWSAYFDSGSGSEYYYNRVTRESTWEAPYLELMEPEKRLLRQATLLMTNPYRPGVPHPLSAWTRAAASFATGVLREQLPESKEPGLSESDTPPSTDEALAPAHALAPTPTGSVYHEWHRYLDPVTLGTYYTQPVLKKSSWVMPSGWEGAEA